MPFQRFAKTLTIRRRQLRGTCNIVFAGKRLVWELLLDRRPWLLFRQGVVKALSGVELPLLGALGRPKVVCSGFFNQKDACCGFFICFCQFIINHCVCRNATTLQISNTHEHTVRGKICCSSRASGVVAVVSRPSMESGEFPLVRSWLFCTNGFWLRLLVARFWLAEVG